MTLCFIQDGEVLLTSTVSPTSHIPTHPLGIGTQPPTTEVQQFSELIGKPIFSLLSSGITWLHFSVFMLPYLWNTLYCWAWIYVTYLYRFEKYRWIFIAMLHCVLKNVYIIRTFLTNNQHYSYIDILVILRITVHYTMYAKIAIPWVANSSCFHADIFPMHIAIVATCRYITCTF